MLKNEKNLFHFYIEVPGNKLFFLGINFQGNHFKSRVTTISYCLKFYPFAAESGSLTKKVSVDLNMNWDDKKCIPKAKQSNKR